MEINSVFKGLRMPDQWLFTLDEVLPSSAMCLRSRFVACWRKFHVPSSRCISWHTDGRQAD